MRKAFPLFVAAFLFCLTVKSQYVTLQDQYFAMNLQLQYPSCFNASLQMDTTCSEIINEDTLHGGGGVRNYDGIQYFKNIKYFFGGSDASPILTTIPMFPATLIYISMQNAGPIQQLPPLPPGLEYLDLSKNWQLASLPALPATLKYLNCNQCEQLLSLPLLPDALEYFNVSVDGFGAISFIPNMPANLKYLNCSRQSITSMPAFASGLTYINCSSNSISNFPNSLPPALQYLNCSSNIIPVLPPLPSTISQLNCSGNALTALPAFPASLDTIEFAGNSISVLPSLPASLIVLNCRSNNLRSLPVVLPANLIMFDCGANPLYSLPQSLPSQLQSLECSNDSLSVLPPLPSSLFGLNCSNNQLSSLPSLPSQLYDLKCFQNNIYCLPKLNNDLQFLYLDNDKIKCLPNNPTFLQRLANSTFGEDLTIPLCDITNNRYNCQSFPIMRGNVFYDLNSNNIKDGNERYKKYERVSLSNNRFTFTNDNGFYEIGTTDTGSYSLSITPPARFHTIPAAFNYHFTTFDSIVNNNFALQPDAVFDSLSISIIPVSWAARPGFNFTYSVCYENTGTTIVTPSMVFNYDNSKVDYVSTDGPNAASNSNTISFSAPSLFPGESNTFYIIFNLKPSVPLGTSVFSQATITGGTANGLDSNRVYVSGSFDPNDKHATPQLSPAQVSAGNSYITYTIRFQNTGTDTAFNIIISDTLSSQLQWNTLKMVQASHTCKTTVENDKAYFEFRNILLPDSNVNEPASHGFVSFKILPKTNVAPNSTINNIGNIFFDFNSPVITNTATTLVKDFTTVPLNLISFNAVLQPGNTVLLKWVTSNEVSTKLFIVEQSTDGTLFSSAGSITAKGNTNNNYAFTVDALQSSKVFYRLKIIDNNGRIAYSPVVFIDKEKTNGFSISPNPAKNFIVINTNDRSLNNTSGSIINAAGSTVKIFTIKEGSQAVNIVGLPAGVYYVKTINGSNKVLIQ